MTEAFPLAWPEGWKRHSGYRDSDSRFRRRYSGSTGGDLTVAKTRNQLLDELRQLGASDVIVSSNIPIKRDGTMYGDQRRVSDPGVAVYFKFKKRPMVMARDQFQTVAGNLRSLTLAIDAMRQLARHGGDMMMERAFTGFVSIAPPTWKKPWREVFGVKPDWKGDIKALFKEKAMNRHPDAGGNDSLMAELNVAYEEAKQELS